VDPVAQQFLAELDAANDELPGSVQAGLAMCGDDVVPALIERLVDRERPITTRAFSAQVLAQLKVAAGWRAMVDVIAGGSVVMLPLLGRILAHGGIPAAEAALSRAEDEELVAEIRIVLAGLAVRAAGAEWAAARVAPIARMTFLEAPVPALALMRTAPSPSYQAVLMENPELMRADPEAALDVLVSLQPEGSDAHRFVEALQSGIDRGIDRVLASVTEGLEPAVAEPSAALLRDEP